MLLNSIYFLVVAPCDKKKCMLRCIKDEVQGLYDVIQLSDIPVKIFQRWKRNYKSQPCQYL